MITIAALLGGLLLIEVPGWWLLEATIPVPRYRVGGLADYVFFTKSLIVVFGSVLFGVVVGWLRARHKHFSQSVMAIFQAGIFGVLAVTLVFFAGGIVYGLVVYGAFAKAIGGTLSGGMVIFWWVLSALVAAELALVYYAVTGRMGAGGAPRGGRSAAPPT